LVAIVPIYRRGYVETRDCNPSRGGLCALIIACASAAIITDGEHACAVEQSADAIATVDRISTANAVGAVE
jgi:hypothetical protein